MSEEVSTLIRLALSSLVDVAIAYPVIIRTDLHACIIHIMASILGSSFCQTGVVPHALTLLKQFLQTLVSSSTTSPEHEAPNIRLALAMFLATLRRAQRREFKNAIQCEKNALLALTIVLNTAASLISPSDELLIRTVDELLDCLSHHLTTLVASGCCRSILLQLRNSPTDLEIYRLLLPRLIRFYLTPPPDDGFSESRTLVGKTLAAAALSMPAMQQAPFFLLLITTILARVEEEGKAVYNEANARLLELASGNPTSFKTAVILIPPRYKSIMEQILTVNGSLTAADRTNEATDAQDLAPSIQLKMNFAV